MNLTEQIRSCLALPFIIAGGILFDIGALILGKTAEETIDELGPIP